MKTKYNLWRLAVLLLSSIGTTASLSAQTPSLKPDATLDDLIGYALSNKIEIKQANLDKQIGEREIASAISGWFPQVNANGGLNHYLLLPTANIGGNEITMGQRNTGTLTVQADQALINPQLFQASKAARYIRQQNDLNIENVKINTVVDISKSYYDILTSEEQINIIKENITRLERQLREASLRYEAGLVDKTDYKRAQISLNNSKAQLKSTEELRRYKYDNLKFLLGMNTSAPVSLSFADQNMEKFVLLDTTELLQLANRVEFKQLKTLQEIQKLNTQYQRWTFLPRVSAFTNYTFNYRNDAFGQLFQNNYPASIVGLSVSIPIFQGTKRIQEIRKSELQEVRLSLDLENLENRISAEYSAAMSTYRASVNEWQNLRENMVLSEEVYNTIKLQYDAGVKTYLELMTAETDLRTSQLNYLNALYAVLASKLDIQKALGTVDIQN